MTNSSVNFSQAPGETILPDPSDKELEALRDALAVGTQEERSALLRKVASSFPGYLDVWGHLSEETPDPIMSYAYARTGYHRGLDALRRAGWKGSGYVKWEHRSNRGFLRSLEGLRRSAAMIGETEEAERCANFLVQCDPSWSGLT